MEQAARKKAVREQAVREQVAWCRKGVMDSRGKVGTVTRNPDATWA